MLLISQECIWVSDSNMQTSMEPVKIKGQDAAAMETAGAAYPHTRIYNMSSYLSAYRSRPHMA